MAGTIHIQNDTKKAHKLFVAWLNLLLNNYISSFYDVAIKNIIQLSFIKNHNSFLQELYQSDGRVLSAFMTVLPTDTTNFLLMIHDKGSGVPKMYNDKDCSNLFTFDSLGRLTKFYDDITIPLYDANKNVVAECFVSFEDWYGRKCPMFFVKDVNTNIILGKGLLDLNFQGFYSGSYRVENKPLTNYEKFAVTNISKMLTVMDVPIQTDLNIRYEIKSEQTIFVPATEWSRYYFEPYKSGLNGLVRLLVQCVFHYI